MKILSVFMLFFMPPMYESALWGMNIKVPWRDWTYIDPNKTPLPDDINVYLNLPWQDYVQSYFPWCFTIGASFFISFIILIILKCYKFI